MAKVKLLLQAATMLLFVMSLAAIPSLAQTGGGASTSGEVAIQVALGNIAPSVIVPNAKHVANGASLRNLDGATIRLNGMPPDATVVEAFLYWDFNGIANFTPGVHDHVLLNGIPVTGTLVGSGADPCWVPGTRNFAFRANVGPGSPTTMVVFGPGEFRVDLVAGATGQTDGADPWNPLAPQPPLAEGASLLVIYTTPSQPLGTVFVYDRGLAGNMFLDNLSYTLVGFPPVPAVASRYWTTIGADGQVGFGVESPATLAQETTRINGVLIAGPGSAANDSDWNGTDGIPQIQLWDTHTHDVSATLPLNATQATVVFLSQGDCLVPVANALTIR